MAERVRAGFERVGYRQRLVEPLVMQAYSTHNLGKLVQSRQLVLYALWSAFEARNRITVSYGLPLIALLPAKEGKVTYAVQIYA